jgi:cell division protein FtsB
MEPSLQHRLPQIGIFIVLLCLLGGAAGWYHTIRMRMYVWRTERVIAQLAQERTQLIAESRHLSGHAVMREKIARELLQLGNDNETVYRTDL